jgi:hypothetical protein
MRCSCHRIVSISAHPGWTLLANNSSPLVRTTRAGAPIAFCIEHAPRLIPARTVAVETPMLELDARTAEVTHPACGERR